MIPVYNLPLNTIIPNKVEVHKPNPETFNDLMDKALNEKDEKKLKESCREFEAIFLGQLIKSMRATVPKNDLFGDSFGHGVFQSMLDDEYAKIMAETESTGLSQLLFQQMKYNLSLANNERAK